MRLGPVPVVLGLSATVVVTSVGCVKGSAVDVSSVTSAVDVSTSFELDVGPADDDGVAVVEDDGSTGVASPEVVVAGGAFAPVVLGLFAGVVDASVGCVKGSGVDVSSVESATDVSLAIVDDWPAVEDDRSSSGVDVSSAPVEDDGSSSVVDVACSVVVPCSGPGGVVV